MARNSVPQTIVLGEMKRTMRLFFAIILTALGAASAANAQSFVTPDEITSPESPSIVTLGATSPSIVAAQTPEFDTPSIERFGTGPTEERKFVAVSPSVIAMVEAPQPIALDNVASIDDEKASKRLRDTMPLVIRGGIVGSAFSSRAVAAAPSAPAGPAPRQEVSAAPEPSARQPAPRQQPGRPPADDRLPKSALPPPAPPTGRVE